MKRFAKLLLFNALVITAIALTTTSCTKEGPTGPAGPAGTNGTNGKDGANGSNGSNGSNGKDGSFFCQMCHNATKMNAIETQWETSKHGEGTSWATEGLRRDCASCHSKQGLLETLMTGRDTTLVNHTVGTTSYNNYVVAQPLDCEGCHDFHLSFDTNDGPDYALRKRDGVSLRWGNHTYTVNLPGSNGCIQCHQARTTSPMPTSMTGTDTITITSNRYGPHYGAMGNIFAGKAPYEFTGSGIYMNSAHTSSLACSDCHMAKFMASTAMGAGGHTWRMADTNGVDNVAGCLKCHAGVTNFDINGKQTEIEGLLTQLGDKLDLLKTGGILLKVGGKRDGSVIASTSNKLKLTSMQAAALLNWTFVFRDRSMGAHNYKYTKALLTNTIAALP
jgi:hypothetical protein